MRLRRRCCRWFSVRRSGPRFEPATSKALDYEKTDTREWLANCCACCAPKSNAFARARVRSRCLRDSMTIRCMGTDRDRCRAQSRQRLAIKPHRLLGHTYPGMLDMHLTSPWSARRPEPTSGAGDVRSPEMRKRRFAYRSAGDADSPVKALRSRTAANRTWNGRQGRGRTRQTDRGLPSTSHVLLSRTGRERVRASRRGYDLGNSLLTARGIPASGGRPEARLAMLAMDRLGAGGSYTEFYAMDFVDNFVLRGMTALDTRDQRSQTGAARSGLVPRQAGSGVSRVQRQARPVTVLDDPDGRRKPQDDLRGGKSVLGPILDRQHKLAPARTGVSGLRQ
jgi:L-arabinose isomerase